MPAQLGSIIIVEQQKTSVFVFLNGRFAAILSVLHCCQWNVLGPNDLLICNILWVI